MKRDAHAWAPAGAKSMPAGCRGVGRAVARQLGARGGRGAGQWGTAGPADAPLLGHFPHSAPVGAIMRLATKVMASEQSAHGVDGNIKVSYRV